MELIDISLPLYPGCPTWPGDELFQRHLVSSLATGDSSNTSAFSASAHAGTHVDAPLHCVADANGVDRIDLATLVGPADVVDVQTAEHVAAQALAPAVVGQPDRLLIRTRNSEPGGAIGGDVFREDYCALTADAADWVVARGVRLLGIDSYSVDSYGDRGACHRILLAAGVVVLEGLDLRRVRPGAYTLIAAPIKLVDFDGAPVRAMLARPEDRRPAHPSCQAESR
jgi:arylformamidase